MTKYNICIVRPEGYIWSSVFLEMAELLAFSLQDIGYPAQITENQILHDAQNIIIGCHLLDISMSAKIPSHSIIFNTEQIGNGPEQWNQRIIHFLRSFRSWDYSIFNIDKVEALGIQRPKHFKFGYHPKLSRITPAESKDIDVLFYGSITPPRDYILRKLEANDIKVMRIFGLFGAERDSYIARSKIIINLHQHNSKIFEIIRAHYLMNNSKAIITQCDHDTKIDSDYKSGMILASYEEIIEKCIMTIHSPEILTDCENRALQTIKKFNSADIMKNLI